MIGHRGAWLLPFLFTLSLTGPCLAEEAAAPMIHVAETVRRLPAVFEGQPATAAFTVQNQGKVALEIVKVSPS